MTELNHIFPDLIVAEVLSRWPETIPVFMAYKLGCVGCSMAPFESLSDAIAVYQLPRKRFLDELERSIQDALAEKADRGDQNHST
jgi:hybrid cluster-associated redox disulfide protein